MVQKTGFLLLVGELAVFDTSGSYLAFKKLFPLLKIQCETLYKNVLIWV